MNIFNFFNKTKRTIFDVFAKKQEYNSNIYNPDKVLYDEQITLDKYSNLLYDPHVWSCIQSRKSPILSMELQVDNDFIKQCLEKLDLRRIIKGFLDAVLYGYSVSEILWTQRDGYIVPLDIVSKPAWWFKFNEFGLLEMTGESGILPSNKFIVIQHEGSYENPYGTALLSRCYYPLVFKKGAMKLWARFVEKYGMPFFHGTTKSGTSKKESEDLYNLLVTMQQDGIAVTSDDIEVNFLDNAKTATSELYHSFIQFCNTEISKAILSQTLTTEQGTTGSYAMSQTHLSVRDDVVEADKKLVESAFNQLIKYILGLNFPNPENVKVTLFEEKDVDMNLANRDAVLFNAGVQFTKPYFISNYGFKETDFDIKQIQQPTFSEFEEDETENFNEIGKNELKAKFKPMVNKVVKLIEGGSSYEEIESTLVKSYSKLDTNDIEEVIGHGLMIANAVGEYKGRNRK